MYSKVGVTERRKAVDLRGKFRIEWSLIIATSVNRLLSRFVIMFRLV